MAKSPKAPVSLDDIRSALKAAVPAFLRAVATRNPGETVYGFLFEISCEGFSAHGAVGTEEGLARYAAKWVEKEGGDLDEMARGFRWGSTEDAWYQQPDEVFGAVNDLLSRAEEQELYEGYDDTLEDLCVEVLKDLDAGGTFGAGAARERVAIGLCYIGGDNSAKEFLGWAKRVNPPSVFKRLRREYSAG